MLTNYIYLLNLLTYVTKGRLKWLGGRT